MTSAGIANNYLGSYEQAVAWCRRAIEANRNYPHSHFGVGDRARAAWSIGRGAFLGPGRARAQSGVHPCARPRRLDGNERRPDVSGRRLERILEGLRKAGVPEQ